MAELLERHDRSRFEILGFSFGMNTADEMGRRVSTAMDRFLDVRLLPDREVAQLSRELEVDIAVDLKGDVYKRQEHGQALGGLRLDIVSGFQPSGFRGLST